MTPHEKAVNAVNARLERLQANLREAKVEAAQRFLFQSLVVTVAIGEALNDYLKTFGAYARRRHAEVKQANETLAATHAERLKTGQELLEQLKANPTDQAVRKEIQVAQQHMAALQKTLRRGTNALQRELAPGLALIDDLAVSVRRFSEAEGADAIKRVLKTMLGQVREFYGQQASLPAKNIIDAPAWEKSAIAEIEQATDYYDGYARAGFTAALALELITLAVSDAPPQTAEDATRRANEAVAARVKEISARLTA